MSNILVAYFSRAGENYVNGSMQQLPQGNTEVVAQMVAEETGGDLFQIETANPYAADYKECVKQAVAELREHARPALKALPESIDGYDTIILGYPNWCGTMPMAVYTFLESFDFSGKTIMPFCTNEGSGLANTEQDIARICPSATVRAGLSIHGAEAAQAHPEVQSWLTQLR